LGVVRDALGCDRAVGEERELEAHHGGGAGVVSSACREERGEADQEDRPGGGEAVSHLLPFPAGRPPATVYVGPPPDMSFTPRWPAVVRWSTPRPWLAASLEVRSG